MPKLTKTTIDNLKPTATEQWVWCSDLPGFGVRCQPSGNKTYIARYRTLDGTQRKQKIARTCDMPPDKARELARKVFAAVAEGKDPKQEQREAKAAPTVAELAERYMKEHAHPFKKPASVRSDANNWRLHILPALGHKKVKAVTKADVLALLGSMSDKQAAGNQVVALLSKAFNLAEDWEWREANSNPCQRVKKYKIKEKELILSPEQIGQLDHAMTAMTRDGQIRPEFAAFIRLLMLTGCRKCEVMHARTEWLDMERGLLLLPDSKVGQRKIQLSPAAMNIAAALKANSGEWLIPGRRNGQPLQTPYKVWKAIKQAAGIPLELRLHDLRHSAGSLAHMAGATQKQVATMLGHNQLSTTERYLHGLTGDAAKVAAQVGDVITKAWASARSVTPQ
jgi:integrase